MKVSRLRFAALLVACGCSEANSNGRTFSDADSSGRTDAASPADRGGRDAGEDAGTMDAAVDAGGTNDGGGSQNFDIGVFVDSWTRAERTRMFLGLDEGSCLLYKSANGQARAAVVFTEGFGQDLWEWSITLDGDDLPAWSDAFLVEDRELRLLRRATNDGSTTVSTTYGGATSDPPTTVILEDGEAPTQSNYLSRNVEAFRFTAQNGMGQSVSLDPQDHLFENSRVQVEVFAESYDGYEIHHTVDGIQEASYRVLPAFGVVQVEFASKTYALCDFRVCSPSGCLGRPSCAELSCAD